MDLTQYNPPGVYVSDVSTPYADPIATTLSDRAICLVGPAVGYQGATESIQLFSESATALSRPNVSQDSDLIVTSANGVPLVLNEDYAVTVDSSNPDAAITSLTRLPADVSEQSPAGVNDGDFVRVSYNYTDPAYGQPQMFTDYGSLAQVYGAPLDNTGEGNIVSPLTMAARVAFENGASRVLCVAVTGTDDASWEASYQTAYAMTATRPDVDVIVPIFPETTGLTADTLSPLLIDLRAHIDQCYNDGYPRIACVGTPAAYDEANNPVGPVAQSILDKRIVFAYPTVLQMFNASTSQTMTVGGTYLAAAFAGRLSMNPVQQGLTRQPISTLSSLTPDVQQKMTRQFMDGLAVDGVAVVMVGRNGRLLVRHGTSTDTTSMVTREISITRAGDTLMLDLQQALDNTGLIGSPITADTVSNVKAILIGELEQEVIAQVINQYASVQVSQRVYPGGDPSIIDCSFQYLPAVPLNYIQVNFSMNLSLGVVAPADDNGSPILDTSVPAV